MTVAELCLLGMVIIIIGSVAPAKFGGRREYDNANPRDPLFYTPGFRTRALGAHQNGYEAFPFFAAAVLLAEMRGVPQGTVDVLAVGFLLARCGYVLAYWTDRPNLRSIIWAVALALNIWIFLLPILAR